MCWIVRTLLFGKKTKRSDYKECGQKDYCKFCAPCPGLNFTKNGSPFVPSENNCYLAKMRKEVADMLKAGSDPLDGASSIEDALCRLPRYTNNHIEITKHKSYYAAWWHTLIIALLLAHQSHLQLSRGFFQFESSCFVFLDEFLYFGISHNRCHLCLCIFMKSYWRFGTWNKSISLGVFSSSYP